ncbi:MAG: PAS domain-containing protein, partial [Crocinitomicaceae bacterium]|nr:PAS domain-containing protein [Crocinitomicaceae bacterium]
MNNNNFHEIVNLLNNTTELIHRLEDDGTISWVNTAWKKTLGVSDKDCLGKRIQDYLSEETKLKFAEIFKRLKNGES